MSSPASHYDQNLLASAPAATKTQLQEGYTTDLLNPNHGKATPPFVPQSGLEGGLGAKEYNQQPPARALPFWRTRKGIIILFVAAIVIVGAVIGGAAGGTAGKKGKKVEGGNSTSVPAPPNITTPDNNQTTSSSDPPQGIGGSKANGTHALDTTGGGDGHDFQSDGGVLMGAQTGANDIERESIQVGSIGRS